MLTALLRLILSPRVVAVLLAAAIAWLFVGARVVAKVGDDPAAQVARMQRELARHDPVAAARFEALARERDVRVVGAVAEGVAAQSTPSALDRFEEELRTPDSVPAELRLAQIAVDARLVGDPERLTSMLARHGAAVDLLRENPSQDHSAPTSVDRYLTALDGARTHDGAWPIVLDDPLALAVWSSIGDDAALWAFFAEHRDLLEELVVDLTALDGVATPREAHELLAEDLRLARANWSIVEPMLRDESLGVAAFGVVRRFGELVGVAVGRHGLALDETLEVVFANADQFESVAAGVESVAAGASARSPAAIDAAASRLAAIRRDRPVLWELARQHPLALHLDRLAPDHATAVLERYGDMDVAQTLVAEFDEREIPKLLQALDRFGDVAVWTIETYADDPRFRAALRRDDVGSSIVPFLATHGDAGLDRVGDSPAWIAKYFEADGAPRRGSAWHAVPLVGAPINLVKNWLDGVPNAWSEYGWALWDVADSAVLVASFGTTAAASQGVRAGVRSTARRAATRGAVVAERGAIAGERSFLGRAARSAGTVAPVRWPVRWPISWVARGGATVAGAGGTTLIALRQGWRAMPPVARRWSLRVIGGAMLFVTLSERTIPGLPAIAEAVGSGAGAAVQQSLEAVGTAIASALEAAFAGGGPLGAVGRSALWWGVLAILLAWPIWRFVRVKRDQNLVKPA